LCRDSGIKAAKGKTFGWRKVQIKALEVNSSPTEAGAIRWFGNLMGIKENTQTRAGGLLLQDRGRKRGLEAKGENDVILFGFEEKKASAGQGKKLEDCWLAAKEEKEKILVGVPTSKLAAVGAMEVPILLPSVCLLLDASTSAFVFKKRFFSSFESKSELRGLLRQKGDVSRFFPVPIGGNT
ncbi:hypothetical protein BDK51DRAFT_34163, partial [Blyttiomyces helicus]